MKKFVCQYAVVQFMPYAETREFANVGVALLCADSGFFGFRLLNRYGRITQFFETIDRRIFLEGKRLFHDELVRVRNELRMVAGEATLATRRFAELTRRREALFRFDEPAVILTEDPQRCLDEQYGYFVERDFATKEYHEQLLERTVRKVLRDADLGKIFQEQEIGDELYHARFPFVAQEGNKPVKLIKPLFLAQAEPSKIITHGDVWIPKVKRLRDRGVLPRRVLFPLDAPAESDVKRFEAYQVVRRDLAQLDVTVTTADDHVGILAFARH